MELLCFCDVWQHWRVPHLNFIIPVAALAGYFSWSNYSQRRRLKGFRFPPGPVALPIIGNVLDMPKTQEWLKAAEWAKTYGDLVFLKPLGKPMLFVNSFEAATNLLDKRSAIYSSRPRSVMVELSGLDWLISNMPYGDCWKKHRTLLQKPLEKASVKKYAGYQLQDAHKLLGKLLDSPNKFRDHIRNSIGGTILRITYGYEVSSEEDRYILLAEQAVRTLVEVATPGAWIVEHFTWMRYIPTLFPGTYFKNVAKQGFKKVQAARIIPYQETKEKYLNGSGQPSITNELIGNYLDDERGVGDEEIIINGAAAFFMAGADTTVASILTFILAMVLFPEVQRRAQEELDHVIGFDRLPTLDDLSSLPYVDALCKETVRWQPIVPLGAPHVLTQDDVYNGYFLPKGTMVLPNQWYMLHDPGVYPDPEAFKPERHLRVYEDGSSKKDRDVPKDPTKIAFGFGRRACPGRSMAMNGIFIIIANILATFNIGKPIGPDGRPTEPDVQYLELISHPSFFEAIITPRSLRHTAMIRQALEAM